MVFNRIAGSLLVLAAVAGFLTVADDLRHTGEFIGVAGILLSGLILLSGGFLPPPWNGLPARLLSGGVFAGMLLGAGLDDMLLGIALGLAAAAVAAVVTGRRISGKRRM